MIPYPRLSERVGQLPTTHFDDIMRRAVEDKSIISMSIGEPDFTAPSHVLRAAQQAVQKKMTHYSPAGGRAALLDAIQKKLKKENKIKLDDPHHEIVVTNGSSEGLFLSALSLIDAGEEMLIPNPGYIAYAPVVDLMQGSPVPYTLRPQNGFELNVDEVRKQITNKTKAILICSPSNPTGNVLSKKTLEELADVAIEKKLTIISDEAYEHLVYEGKHVSIGSLNGMKDRVISLYSFSKSYAMPGFRLGYAVGPTELIKPMQRIHLYTSISAGTISQLAGIVALQSSKNSIEKMKNEYARRRKFVLKSLNQMNGLEIEKEPQGAFYVFPKITVKKNSNQMADYLLKKAKVLTVPGNEFGTAGEGFIRLSYATALPKIKIAMERMKEALQTI